MPVFRTTASPGSDGLIHLAIPLPPGQYEVAVTLRRIGPPAAEGSPESRGWPPGFFDRTAGSIPDFTIEPRNQGTFEYREPLE